MSDLFLRYPGTVWGILLLLALLGAGLVGLALQIRSVKSGGPDKWDETQEGYIVSAVVTLLAFMIGFTFALALDRFEGRRQLVGQDARAIEELYLKAQILEEPHRSAVSNILVQYTDNRIQLASLRSNELGKAEALNDKLTKDLWKASMAAFQTIRGIDFSSAFVDSANRVIDLNSARIAARKAQIPGEVLLALFIYAVVTAAILGYVLKGRRSRVAGVTLLFLYVMLMSLLIDLNQPTTGFIRESQGPMEHLSRWMHANNSASFGPSQLPAISSETAR